MTVRAQPATGRAAIADADWREAIRRHDRAVWLSVIALGIAPDAAREIVQAAWARIAEQVGRGALADVQLPGLAIVQARFLALDELRRARREASRRADVAELDDVAGDDPEHVLSRDALDRVLRRLAACTAQQQRVFRLAYDDFKPHDDIARELGLSLQRVRQILCEVRSKLRTVIEES